MKILAISAGSRDGSNDAMARESLMGALAAGAEVEFIRLLDLDIAPCTGCVACSVGLTKGGTGDCVIKDDFQWLENKVLDADGLIWVNPVFEKGIPGIMRVVQDRIAGPGHDTGMCIIAGKIAQQTGGPGPDPRKLKPKATSFIGIGGSDWASRISTDMNLVAMSGMWRVIDDEVFKWSKSIVLDDAAVAKCRQIGVNIAVACKDLENAKFLGDPGTCGVCHSRNFYIRPEDGRAECEVCGVVGDLVRENGQYVFKYVEEQLEHAHTMLPGKFKHMDDIRENEGKLAEDKKKPEFKEIKAKYKAFITASMPPKA